ncbi:MAG TPA: hypothetical protein VN699_03725 [Pirellulales bacterium]|jgi:hypothetical protein|nr:hypothetical protein [Pirellulales bacterium]
MKPADLTSGAGRMQDAMKTLKLRWDETKEVWNDARRAEFEAAYIEPLEPQVRMTLDRLRRLALVFSQAFQECT